MKAVGPSAPETRADKQRKRTRSMSRKGTTPSKKSRGNGQRSSDCEENKKKLLELAGPSTKRRSSPESCQVFFCGTSLMASSSTSGSCGGILKGIFDKVPCTQHWFAAFVYSDDEVVVCEAAKNEMDVLKGKWTLQDKGYIDRISNFKILITECKISQAHIKRTVNKMTDYGTYDVVENNCQTWLHHLFTRLGLPTKHVAALSAKAVVNTVRSLVSVFSK